MGDVTLTRRSFGAVAAIQIALPQYADALPLEIRQWFETAEIEHQARQARLQRLVAELLPTDPPELVTYHQPNVLVDGRTYTLPILRAIFSLHTFFRSGSDDLSDTALHIIDAVANCLRLEAPDTSLFVCGHTDNVGAPDGNYALSAARAWIVARALVERGVGESQVYRVGFGSDMPIGNNDTEFGRAKNRRCEFLFAARPQAVVDWIEAFDHDLCWESPGELPGTCVRRQQQLRRQHRVTADEVLLGVAGVRRGRSVEILLGGN